MYDGKLFKETSECQINKSNAYLSYNMRIEKLSVRKWIKAVFNEKEENR